MSNRRIDEETARRVSAERAIDFTDAVGEILKDAGLIDLKSMYHLMQSARSIRGWQFAFPPITLKIVQEKLTRLCVEFDTPTLTESE